MRDGVRIEGSRELQRAFARMGDDVRQAAGVAVKETAQELEGAVKLKIQQGTKTGRVYDTLFFTAANGKVIPYGSRPRHKASAPGEAPASDTGTLIGSIYHEREGDLTYAVGTRLGYAEYLEYGTSRMAARPFFRPAVEQIKPVYLGRLERIIGEAMQ